MRNYLNYPERFVNSCIKHEIIVVSQININMVNSTTPYENVILTIPQNEYATGDNNHKVKLPRNSMCLCGSGLKHKKCCGKFEE